MNLYESLKGNLKEAGKRPVDWKNGGPRNREEYNEIKDDNYHILYKTHKTNGGINLGPRDGSVGAFTKYRDPKGKIKEVYNDFQPGATEEDLKKYGKALNKYGYKAVKNKINAGEPLEETSKLNEREEERSWSDDGKSLNIREMVARALENNIHDHEFTDEEIDQIFGEVVDEDQYMEEIYMEIENQALQVAKKYLSGMNESANTLKESSLLDPAFTVCYNRLDIFPTRKAAMDFFKTCMYSSEGSERDRYTNVYLELMDGSDTGFDGDGDSVNEVAWVNEDGNVVEKEKLGSWEDANKIIGQIKGGKKMPPKGFLDLFK